MNRSEHGRTVATNVQRLRESQGLSLSALARRSNVAKATLSAIEHGEGNPTISTLHALAGALRVGVTELVGEHRAGGIRLVRGAGGSHGTDDVPIESFVPEGVVEVYDLRYEPGTRHEFDAHQRGVVERILVQTGSLRVGPVDDTVQLQAGDFLVFPADRPHRFQAIEGPVRGTLIVTYPVTAPAGSPVHGATRD